MDDIIVLGDDREKGIFNQVIALHGAPAYIRRARRMEDAWNGLVENCRQRRHKELTMVQMRLGKLRALAGSWTALRPFLADDEQVAILERLELETRPSLRLPPDATSSRRQLRQALRELLESMTYFNARWLAELSKVDLSEVNRLRDGYNRYYLVEKECAMRSPRAARQGFEPMAPATTADLAALLPILTIPELGEPGA